MPKEYVHPDMLVSTQWVADHLNDPQVVIGESDEDPLLYEVGHVPAAVKLDWYTDLQDTVRRDFVDRHQFEELLSKRGIANSTTLVLYGDRNNWFACYALWICKMYGHGDVRIMNGGRQKWIDEGRPLVKDVPQRTPTQYRAHEANLRIRAFREQVMEHIRRPGTALVDVRSSQEYTGELLHMPNYPQEGALRGGHIPGAANIPWATAANPDGTFKTAEELDKLYGDRGITSDKDIIAYCRIGERSSHTWFVLTYLLGYANVRNYDGSWTEWGNLVNAPVEKIYQPK